MRPDDRVPTTLIQPQVRLTAVQVCLKLYKIWLVHNHGQFRRGYALQDGTKVKGMAIRGSWGEKYNTATKNRYAKRTDKCEVDESMQEGKGGNDRSTRCVAVTIL